MRVVKMWNSSGNKWYGMVDIAKTLKNGENDALLYFLVVLSQSFFVGYILKGFSNGSLSTWHSLTKVFAGCCRFSSQ